MLTDLELKEPESKDNINEAIKEIGQDKTCFLPSDLEGAKKAILEKGYEGAEEYAEHLTGTAYTELSRVLIICKEKNLSPEAAAEVIENLNKLESGNWSDEVGKTNAGAGREVRVDADKFKAGLNKIKADMDKAIVGAGSKVRADGDKIKADMDKIKASLDKANAGEEAQFVNECQFTGHEPEEKAADAKAKMLLTRSDVNGKCE